MIIPEKQTLRERGLTLFELLVVLAILALLATLIAPRVVGYLGRAKSDIARSNVAGIASSLELFYLDYGRYPTTEEGLTILAQAPDLDADADADEFWRGPYIKDETNFTDPWGRAYVFETTGDAFVVKSLGRDGAPGGDGEDADIVKS